MDYTSYDGAMNTQVSAALPSSLAKNHMVTSLRVFLTAISAESQLQALVAEGSVDPSKDDYKKTLSAIKKNRTPPHFGASDVKEFSRLLFSQAKYGAADYLDNTKPDGALLALDTAKPAGAISYYLSAYYKGKFYDRMGTLIGKPQLTTSQGSSIGNTSFSLPDSQITAAETVLLEYLCDLIFPAPVMGDGPDAKSAKNFYPAGSANEPTALLAGTAGYQPIQPSGCGITVQNVWVVKDLANGASDQAATVGGLVVNTTGGISFGLGVMGKVSIGDNQTLSDLVKTAASEIALRATLDAAYYSLRHVDFPIPEPGN